MSGRRRFIGIVIISAVLLLLAVLALQQLGLLGGNASPDECIEKAEELGAPENVIGLLKRPTEDLNFVERTLIRKTLESIGLDELCGHFLDDERNETAKSDDADKDKDVESTRKDETVSPTAEPQQPDAPATAVPPIDAISAAAAELLAQPKAEAALNTSISEDCLFAVVRAETGEAMLNKVRDANPAELSDLERYKWNLLLSRYYDDSDLIFGMNAYFVAPRSDLSKNQQMASECAELWTAPITEQNIDKRNDEMIGLCSPLELLRYENDEYANFPSAMIRDIDALLKRPYQSLTLADRIVLRQSLESDYCTMYYPQLYFENWVPVFVRILQDEEDNDINIYIALFGGKASYAEGEMFVAHPRGKPIICSEEELELYGDHSYYPNRDQWEFDAATRSCELQPIARESNYDNDYLEAGQGIRQRNGDILVCHPGIEPDSGWRWDSESNSNWRCVRRF